MVVCIYIQKGCSGYRAPFFLPPLGARSSMSPPAERDPTMNNDSKNFHTINPAKITQNLLCENFRFDDLRIIFGVQMLKLKF